MKPTDLAHSLTNFLSKYLPGERGISANTIASYSITFSLYLSFMNEHKKISADKLELKDITKESVVSFLDWLQSARNCSDATRNVRLAAIHSFFKYLQYHQPAHLSEWQRILSIKVKKTKKETIKHLSLEGIKLLLAQPDTSVAKGRRDLAMLALMYDCGARVQEVIDLTPAEIRFQKPYTIKLIGKGNKARIIPLIEAQVFHLQRYVKEHALLDVYRINEPLFYNSRRTKLTRAGINAILKKYADKAKAKCSNVLPDRISCHMLRHSKSMHLLQAGVILVHIRDFLGHESIQTTEIYARADSKQKKEAIEKAYVDLVDKETPVWIGNDNLLEWLKSLR
jgi:integrase/recombinase XerD